jgi:hypothetical protein
MEKPAQFDKQTIASPPVAFASLSFATAQLFLRRPLSDLNAELILHR